VPDDEGAGSAAVAQVLRRSRGLPLLVRLVVDAFRVAVAAGATAFAWAHVAPSIAPALPAALPESSHPIVLGGLLVVLAAGVSLSLFRITSPRFVRPLRGHGA
jgi:hypothetical protein